MLIIHTDGGARGNPGPAAIGIVIQKLPITNYQLPKKIKKTIGVATNNEAEYLAAICGLEEGLALGEIEAELRVDSQLIAMQLQRKWKIKEPRLQELFLKAWPVMQQYKKLTIRDIPREQNREADALVNEALDEARM